MPHWRRPLKPESNWLRLLCVHADLPRHLKAGVAGSAFAALGSAEANLCAIDFVAGSDSAGDSGSEHLDRGHGHGGEIRLA